jgi:two-component system response regulator GlrR
MPSLRERREDIAPMVNHFLERIAARTARSPKRFAPDAMRQLLEADLPGNVRQLQNVVEQCSVLSPSDVISPAFTTQALHSRPSNVPTLDEAKQSFERRYLISVLRASEGNITTAARMAGRNRTEFYKLVGRYELDPAQFRRRKRQKKQDADEASPPLIGQQMDPE